MLGIKLTKKYRVGLENFWNVRWLSIKKLTRQQQKGNKAILTGKSFTSFDTFFNNTTTAAVSKQHCEIFTVAMRVTLIHGDKGFGEFWGTVVVATGYGSGIIYSNEVDSPNSWLNYWFQL